MKNKLLKSNKSWKNKYRKRIGGGILEDYVDMQNRQIMDLTNRQKAILLSRINELIEENNKLKEKIETLERLQPTVTAISNNKATIL